MFETRDPFEERPGNHGKVLFLFVLTVGFVVYWIMYGLAAIASTTQP